MMNFFSSMAIGISLMPPPCSIARHSGSPTPQIIFTRCISAQPRVAVVRARNKPRWFSIKGTSRFNDPSPLNILRNRRWMVRPRITVRYTYMSTNGQNVSILFSHVPPTCCRVSPMIIVSATAYTIAGMAALYVVIHWKA